MADWISLVEAAYDLTSSRREWLEGLLRHAAPLLEGGDSVTGQIVCNEVPGVVVEEVAVVGDQANVEYVKRSIATAPPEGLDLVYRSGITASTLSEVLFPNVPGSAEAFAAATEGRYRDTLGVVAYTGVGRIVAVNTPLAVPRLMSPRERRLWTQAAAHLGAGLRLRHLLAAAPSDADRTEAIFTPGARACDARGPARRGSTLEHLREAVKRVETARGRLRREDPGQALSLWEGLVMGRWSLVDRFESDGRRFVVAVRNDPPLGDPRGLTPRELQVADLVGLGRPTKEVGYTLGISESAVNNALGRIRAKLGLGSRSELVAFFAPGGVRARLARVDVGEQPLLVGSYGGAAGGPLQTLTDAERDVALLLLQGATNRAIAARRGSSENTVANQIKSVFAKLGVRSRAELTALLSPSPE